MNISSRTEYGIRALLVVASSKGQLKRSEIAQAAGIPLPFLTQILQSLITAQLIKSQRGPEGGYLLAKDPAKISLLEVITALQGPIVPRGCVDLGEPTVCHIEHSCSLKNVWAKLKEANEAVLASYSLKDLVANSLRGEKNASVYG